MVEVWFFYIITSVIFWGLNAIIDKVVLTKHLNAFSYSIAYIPARLIVLVGILLFVPINFNSNFFYLAFAAGILSVCGYYLYAFAMKREEASRISALTSLYPAFVAVLAAVFLNEIFSIKSYAGILLVILGAVLISYRRKTGNAQKMIPFAIILIVIGTNGFYGIEQTISKISLNYYQFWQFFAIYSISSLLMTFPPLVIPHFRNSFVKELMGLKRNMIFLLLFSSTIWILGVALFFYSASLGPVTLVSTLSITSPFLTLLFTIALSKFWPKILKEEIDRKTVALKLFSIALIFLGTYLIMA